MDATSPSSNAPVLDRRQRKSRERIRNACTDLLGEKDLSSITVKEIAERADISRKTFYLHYGSIDDLIDDLIKDDMEKVADELCTLVTPDGNGLDAYNLFVSLGERILIGFNRRVTVVDHVGPEVLLERLRPILTDTLAKRDSLGLAEDLGPYLNIFVGYFCAALLSVYHQWLSADSDLPMEQVAALTGAAMAGGISALTKEARMLGVGQAPSSEVS